MIPSGAAALFRTVMSALDRRWDDDARLLTNFAGRYDGRPLPGGVLQLVPYSAWYAYGLLSRGGADDVARAASVLERLRGLQYRTGDPEYVGTFARYGNTDRPPASPRVWVDYDPNWRQFVGTALALIVEHFPGQVPRGLVDAMDDAATLAARSDPAGRVPASYSNIALMRAWLDAHQGVRTDDRALRTRGERLATDIVRDFDEFGALAEYNSPTYYGICLYALALWIRHPPTDVFHTDGLRVWNTVWTDVARLYHPGLRNLCGPYTRAYGMNMLGTVSALGLWIAAYGAADVRPLPDVGGDVVDQGHDLALGAVIPGIAHQIPASVAAALSEHTGPRHVARPLPDGRHATAFLAATHMLGAERAPLERHLDDQAVHASAHWRDGDAVGWLRVRSAGVVDAHVLDDGVLRYVGRPTHCAVVDVAHHGVTEQVSDRLVVVRSATATVRIESRRLRVQRGRDVTHVHATPSDLTGTVEITIHVDRG